MLFRSLFLLQQIPDPLMQAQITLTDGKKKLYEGEVPVTQFGIIEYLAPVLFNKNSTIKVYFDPNTGGLLKVDREEGK